MEEELLPGLPDDIAIDCLARVPQESFRRLRHVCRRWRNLVSGAAFRRRRELIGAAEDLVFIIQAAAPSETIAAPGEEEEEDKDQQQAMRKATTSPLLCSLAVYNATSNKWRRAAPPTSPPLPMFAQCAAAGGRFLVLAGGWDPATLDPTPETHVADLASGAWLPGRSAMTTARSFFACAAGADGRVYVAGGHDRQKNALRSAEAYDPGADEWVELPEMGVERDECQGAAAGGRFWAVSGYPTDRQGGFGSDAEWFDPAAGEWRREEGVWELEDAPSAALYGVEVGEGGKLGYVDEREMKEWEGKGWRTKKKTTPEGGSAGVMIMMKGGLSAAAIGGGGGRVFMVGSEGGGGCAAWIVDDDDDGGGRRRRVEVPAEFSGTVYSVAAMRI